MRSPSPLPDSTVLESSIRPDADEVVDIEIQAEVRDLIRDAFAPMRRTINPADTVEATEGSILQPSAPTAPDVLNTPSNTFQEVPVFFTLLSSIRGSLRLGGTAHHSHLSRGSLRSSGVSQEGLALPLASTGQLVVVPDAVSARSSIHAHARVEEHLRQPEGRTADRETSQRPRRRRRQPSQHRSLRRRILTLIAFVTVFVALLSTYLMLALAGRGSVLVFVHVLFVLSLMVLLILIIHASIRFCLIFSHKKDNNRDYKSRRSARHRHRRQMPTTPTEENLVPSSPIAVRCDDDADAAFGLDLESGPEPQTPGAPRLPPPAYGRWRGSVRLDPDLMHWQRVESSALDEGSRENGSAEGPPTYVSPRTHRMEMLERESGMVVGRSEMFQIGRVP